MKSLSKNLIFNAAALTLTILWMGFLIFIGQMSLLLFIINGLVLYIYINNLMKIQAAKTEDHEADK